MPIYYHYTPTANLQSILKEGFYPRNPTHPDSPYHADAMFLKNQPEGVYACRNLSQAAFWGVDVFLNCLTEISLIVFHSETDYQNDEADEHAFILKSHIAPQNIIEHHTFHYEDFVDADWFEGCLEDIDPEYLEGLVIYQDQMTDLLIRVTSHLDHALKI